MFVSGMVLLENIAYSAASVSLPDRTLCAFIHSKAMPNRPWCDDEEDWSETGGDQDADPDSDDPDADDETITCPECRAAIYADLDHCPRCGHWFTEADRSGSESGIFATRCVRLIAAALLAIFVFSLLAELVLFR